MQWPGTNSIPHYYTVVYCSVDSEGSVCLPAVVGVGVGPLAVCLEGGQEVRGVEAHGARHVHCAEVVHEELAVVRVVRRTRIQLEVHEILRARNGLMPFSSGNQYQRGEDAPPVPCRDSSMAEFALRRSPAQ